MVKNASRYDATEISNNGVFVELLGEQEQAVIEDVAVERDKVFKMANADFIQEVGHIGVSIENIFHHSIDFNAEEAVCVIGIGETPPNISLFTRTSSPI